jgi:hypothetical protein
MFRPHHIFALAIFSTAWPTGGFAESPHHDVLSLGPPGVATPLPDTLSVAAPLANISKHAVKDVKITHVELGKAPIQTSLPISVGDIPAGGNVLIQAQFGNSRLTSGKTYEFEVSGYYRGRDWDDDRHGDDDRHDDRKRQGRDDDDHGLEERRFRVHAAVIIPPPPNSSAQLSSVQIPSQTVTGGNFPPRPPQQDPDVNSGGPIVPTNPESLGVPTQDLTRIQPAQ